MSLASLFRKRRTAPRGRMMHLPDDLLNPPRIAILAGPSGYDIWGSLILANSLTRSMPETEVAMIVSVADGDVLLLLERPVSVTTYDPDGPKGRIYEGPLPESGILFVVSEYPDARLHAVTRAFPDSIRIFTRPDESANLVLNPGGMPTPSRMHALARLVGAQPDESWRPSLSREDMARAASLLSPGSGTVLPYMAATGRASQILRRSAAELPMRTVITDGRKNPLALQPPLVKAAIIAGASVVATDDPVQWAQASALGVPVIGLDRKASFPTWETTPSRGAAGFTAAWIELLARGW